MRDILEANLRTIQARVKGKKSKPLKANEYVKKISELDDASEIAKRLIARARYAVDFRQPIEELWRRAYKAWMQVLEEGSSEAKWRSKRYIPVIFQHIEAALPSIASAIFGGSKIWELRGLTPQFRDSADALLDLMEWQARGPSRMKHAYLKMLWWSLVTGTGILDHQWAYETEERRVPVVEGDVNGDGSPIDEQGNPILPGSGVKQKQVKVMRKKVVTVDDQPILRALNPFHVWLNPNSEPGDNVGWAFLRHDTTVDKIVRAAMAENSHLDPEAVEEWITTLKDTGWQPSADDFDAGMNLSQFEDLQEETGTGSRDGADGTEDNGPERNVTLLVYRSDTETITLAPNKRIIGYSENPYAHRRTGLVVHSPFPVPGSPYGRGIGTVLVPHQELINKNINTMMDTVELSLMAPIGVDRSRISTLDDNFRWQPNALIRTRGAPRDAVTRLDMPAPTNIGLTIDQHIRKDAEETTGFTEQARGMTPQGVNTATEFTGMQANIKTRTFMHVERLRETLELSGQLLVDLNQQYMTQEQIISVVGENGLYYKTIDPVQIVGRFTVHATVNSGRMAPAMKVQQLIAVTQIVVPMIQQAGTNPFLNRWLRMILKEIEVDDIDRILPKNPDNVRDPWAENIALRQGVKIVASVYDDVQMHIQAHQQEIMELQGQEGRQDEVAAIMAHIESHIQVASQKQMQGMSGAPNAPAPTGGSPERQDAQAQGAAQGSNGTPGAASPGPAAPAGRPM